MSYSQGKEEEIILAKISALQGERCVLDIGAGDGVTYSNSAALIDRGWFAVLVEPNPYAFAKLHSRYKGQTKVALVNAALGFEAGHLATFFECSDSLYSTLKPEVAQLWQGRGKEYSKYFVPQVTMEMLTSQIVKKADVISIDAEGISFDLLKAIPLDAWAPHVIVVEHDSRQSEASQWAYNRGYETVYLDDQNIILLRPEKWTRRN